MRHSGEGQLNIAQFSLNGEAKARKMGEDIRQPLAGGAAAGNRNKLNVRVLLQIPGQFHAYIAGDINDTYPGFIHSITSDIPNIYYR